MKKLVLCALLCAMVLTVGLVVAQTPAQPPDKGCVKAEGLHDGDPYEFVVRKDDLIVIKVTNEKGKGNSIHFIDNPKDGWIGVVLDLKALKKDPKTEVDWRELLKFRSEWRLMLAHFDFKDGEIKHPVSFRIIRVTFSKCL